MTDNHSPTIGEHTHNEKVPTSTEHSEMERREAELRKRFEEVFNKVWSEVLLPWTTTQFLVRDEEDDHFTHALLAVLAAMMTWPDVEDFLSDSAYETGEAILKIVRGLAATYFAEVMDYEDKDKK